MPGPAILERFTVAEDASLTEVVIADANPLTRWSIAQYLERWCVIETAQTLSEARGLLRDHHPVALIIGDEFPDGPGREVIREVREASPETRIVQLCVEACDGQATGESADARVVRMEKPFDLRTLARVIGFDAPC